MATLGWLGAPSCKMPRKTTSCTSCDHLDGWGAVVVSAAPHLCELLRARCRRGFLKVVARLICFAQPTVHHVEGMWIATWVPGTTKKDHPAPAWKASCLWHSHQPSAKLICQVQKDKPRDTSTITETNIRSNQQQISTTNASTSTNNINN